MLKDFKVRWIAIPVFILLVANFMMSSCSSSSNGGADQALELKLQSEEADAEKGAIVLFIKAPGAWTLELEYKAGVEPWCTIAEEHMTGVGNKQVFLQFDKNRLKQRRTVTVILHSGNSALQRVEFTQKPGDEDAPGPVTDVPAGWLEIPKLNDMPNTKFVYHKTTINNKKVRNFSLYFDVKEKVAYWVAYPHIASYRGSSGRTDAWQFDSKFATSEQPNLKRGIGSGFDRGHQIPSGDRTADYETNAQTFFYTNMTPQVSTLNQGWWASLENNVRNWLGSDTLYVVTGAILQTASGNEHVSYAKDNDGASIAIPNFYFKVLLQKHNREVGSKHGYRSIGFWVDNAPHYTSEGLLPFAKTVREIEELTGFDFFFMLSDVDKDITPQMADEIETTHMPAAWGISK